MTYRNQNSVNDVGQYQMSGLPFVTASNIAVANGTVAISFPFVTNFFSVKNNTASSILRVGFTANGVTGTNYYGVTTTAPLSVDLRVRDLYFLVGSGSTISFELIAGLTTINSASFPVLTGSTPDGNTNFVYSYPGIG